MPELENKTVLVTGASRGIGRATAAALASAGAHVLVHYGRSAHEAESLVAAIRAEGGRANAVSADLSGSQNSRRRFAALTGNMRIAMNNTPSKGKEIRIPGPDHPIAISPAEGTVRVMVAGKIVAESTRALRLEEMGHPPVYYLPRSDADISLLVRATHSTYCPYKGDCSYYSIRIGGSRS
ncbi:MAG TPA: SDR family NAD(P)-dependent oxidoreductase [Acidobacteriaceae bacterium]|jgi:uncharacterized protein (DUF427 family)|nr:SDR family NAD(P)-dependent oxidoreductase [Acidobacteriaceae bacterium]